MADVKKDELATKLKELSLERGDGGKTKTKNFQVLEKEPGDHTTAPPQPGKGDLIEGLPTKTTRS